MSNKFRLSSGGQINRTERISFKFNGKTFFGFKGDTLASALLANNIKTVGRSEWHNTLDRHGGCIALRFHIFPDLFYNYGR